MFGPKLLPWVLTVFSAAILAGAPQSQTLGIDDVKPGMVGVGKTVFAGGVLEEFRAQILGTLRNVVGPGRHLIVAKLEGGPLAQTGVISGMSGSPVYVDGKLIGAVAYSMGSFAKEPFAGITPIGEMLSAVDAPLTRPATTFALPSSPSAADVYAALRRVANQAAMPLLSAGPPVDPADASEWARLASGLRPIGAALLLGGADPSVERELKLALPAGIVGQSRAAAPESGVPLRPGDPIGVSLLRGDFEMGATGTVTDIRGNRVYAFGHPFLNLGTTTMAMTKAQVMAVLPSLDSSMKIASLGSVIGTMTQDRAVAIGGTLGAGPPELAVKITMSSPGSPDRQFNCFVVQDQSLTPLFSFVAILNALSAYERQVGTISVAASGRVSFGPAGQVVFDDVFAGSGAASAVASAATAAIAAAASNEFRSVLPQSLEIALRASEQEASATIERVWLDTTKPHFGATHALQVLLKNYRGVSETVSIPVQMPAQATGPVTVLVSDGATLGGLEQRELAPARPANFEGLISQLNRAKRGNRLYVRLLMGGQGFASVGQNMPALPPSAQSILGADRSTTSQPIGRSIVGEWERRFDKVIRGSREITITLTADR